jgi:hypothetical protein
MATRPLRRWPLVIVIVGGIWFLQGIGVLPGSFMSGDPTWAYIGGAMVLAGALLTFRRPGRT